MIIDINDITFRDVPIWCVHGPECNPSILCCKVIADLDCEDVIWGYSTYEGVPGFRTLGLNLYSWIDKNKEYGVPVLFFDTQDSALLYLKTLITPIMPENKTFIKPVRKAENGEGCNFDLLLETSGNIPDSIAMGKPRLTRYSDEVYKK